MKAKKQNKKEAKIEAERRELSDYEHIGQAIDDPNFEFEEFTDELEKELRYLFRNGCDTDKLARKTGIFEWAIRERLGLKQKEDR